MGKNYLSNSCHRLSALPQNASEQCYCLFDYISDVYVFIKDLEGSYLYANKAFLKRFGLNSIYELKKIEDDQLAPKELVQRYLEDDQIVLRGEKLENIIEPVSSLKGLTTMHQTIKSPLVDDKGSIAGIIGLTQDILKVENPKPENSSLSNVIEMIENQYKDKLTMEKLAESAHMSVSTLKRQFNKVMKTSPSKYLNLIRIKEVRKLLVNTNLNLSVIAFQTGFSDHSHMSLAFKNVTGISPKEYRKLCESQI